MNTFKKAFTLVELLVVVTLLSILSTIAYIYFDGNLGETRDAKRQSDLHEMMNVLELYNTEKGFFPEPSHAVNVTYSGSAVAWTQGTFGESVSKIVKLFGMDYPKDPLYDNEYTYSITSKGKEFQIASIRENLEYEEGLGELAGSIVPQAQAASIETAYVLGDYNGFMVKAIDGGIDHFIATPSIISSDLSDPDVINTITNQNLVYNEFFNLPASYSGFVDLAGGFNFNVTDPVIFSGTSGDLKNETDLLEFNEKLKYIYATTPTESFDQYVSILEKEGLTSLKGFLTRKFKISFRTYFNCKDILDAGVSEGDKNYTIDPDGPGGADPYEVYCDMTTDGGGWTRVGDNHVTNGNFASGSGILDAVRNTVDTNSVVALNTPVDGNNYALHQTGNYSSNYKVSFDDPSILKPGYEVRMSLWRSDYGSGAVDAGTTNTKILAGKSNPWTIGASTFSRFNQKMNYAPNFGPGGILTDIDITVIPMVDTVTTSYLDGGILFDGYIPDNSRQFRAGTWIYPYTNSEISAIDEWVLAGGFLLSTNDYNDWDPLGTYYNMESGGNHQNVSKFWEIANVDHPLVNGSIGLGRDLRGQTLIGDDAYSGLIGTVLPDDLILARDKYAPYLPTVILRKHGKGQLLITSDEGVFRNMSSGNTFQINDNEDAFAAAIMAYSIETAAGINPHEGYAFHNRIHYTDGTYSTNGEDKILQTITVNDGGTDRIWTYEQTRHKIYKTPENFDWYIGLDANNNKDLYFTGVRLELFYR